MPEMGAWKDFHHTPPPAPPPYMPTFPSFTVDDVAVEAVTLDRLAELTADLNDPQAAASKLFGEAQEG